MKKFFVKLLCLSLSFMCVQSYTYVEATESKDEPKVCEGAKSPELIEEEYNEKNHKIVKFSDGVEVEYLDENTVIIRDYKYAISSSMPSTSRGSWLEIGKAIIKILRGVLEVCSTVEYITGHDLCRIVIDYITTPKIDGEYEYRITGNFIDGYIPGCEPSHSWGCNTGYWEYEVVLV